MIGGYYNKVIVRKRNSQIGEKWICISCDFVNLVCEPHLFHCYFRYIR